MNLNTTMDYREIYARDRYRCIYCGRDMLKSLDDWLSLEIDHIIPSSKSEDNSLDNMVTSCNVCNKYKSSYFHEDLLKLSREKQIEKIREHVLKKRLEQQLRWLKALRQYDDFKKTNILKDDSNLKRSPATELEI